MEWKKKGAKGRPEESKTVFSVSIENEKSVSY